MNAEQIDVVIVDCQLTPAQQRNLERAVDAKVIDRTGLILEIFGERARTREGQLQVELAHLSYQRSRLVRSWTHLERQRGLVEHQRAQHQPVEQHRRQHADLGERMPDGDGGGLRHGRRNIANAPR